MRPVNLGRPQRVSPLPCYYLVKRLFRDRERGRMGKIMKGVATLPFAGALALALAGCGADHTPRPAVTVTITVTVSPKATAASSPASAAPATAAPQSTLLA